MAVGNKTVNVVVTGDDFEWLSNEAKNGPYQYPSTLARYLLAEIIKEKRAASVETKSENTGSDSGSDGNN
jgi:hypothetical protein